APSAGPWWPGNTPSAEAPRTSGTAWRPEPGSLRPPVPAGSRESTLVLAQQGLQFFSRAQLQHGLAIGLLQVLELALVLLAHVLRLGAQRVLHAGFGMLHPFLDLGRRKIELPTRLRNRGLALDDLQHQRRLAPRRPTLDFFFHHHAHECLLRKVTPEQEITGSLQHHNQGKNKKASSGHGPMISPPEHLC